MHGNLAWLLRPHQTGSERSRASLTQSSSASNSKRSYEEEDTCFHMRRRIHACHLSSKREEDTCMSYELSALFSTVYQVASSRRGPEQTGGVGGVTTDKHRRWQDTGQAANACMHSPAQERG